MAKRILVITDQVRAGWVREAHRSKADARWFSIVLGASASRYLRRNQEAFRSLEHNVIPLADYVERAQSQLQAFYPEFVYHFPRYIRLNGLTLLELLRQKNDINLWWLTETCEKSPLRGPLVNQLYALALLSQALDKEYFDEIWLWLEDKDLRACIAAGLSAAGCRVRSFRVRSQLGAKQRLIRGRGHLVRLLILRLWVVANALLSRLVLFLGKVRPPGSDAGRPLIGLYSRYPVLWRNPYTFDQSERYFSHLTARLRKEAEAFYFVALSDQPWQLYKRRQHLQAIFSNQNIVPLVLYLTVADLLHLLLDLSLPIRYLRYRWQMARALRVSFLNWDISRLWDAELRRALTGIEVQQNLLLMAAVRRLTSKLRISALINPLEFQPMERAIWAGARGRTVTVAVQHSTFCRNHFMYFFKENELQDYVGNKLVDASPLPDYCLVAGVWPYKVMLRNGISPERLGICGAIRYNDLLLENGDLQKQRRLREELGVPLEKLAVLVLTPQSHDESIDLIETLAQAALELDERFVFLFRCHYHCRVENQIERLFARLASRVNYRILDTNGSIYDQIRASNVVLVGGTSAALEALALGRLPIVYSAPTLLNLSSLMDMPGTALFVSTAEELATALKQLKAGGLNEQVFFACRDKAIEELFYQLDGRADERFLFFLNEKRLLKV